MTQSSALLALPLDPLLHVLKTLDFPALLSFRQSNSRFERVITRHQMSLAKREIRAVRISYVSPSELELILQNSTLAKFSIAIKHPDNQTAIYRSFEQSSRKRRLSHLTQHSPSLNCPSTSRFSTTQTASIPDSMRHYLLSKLANCNIRVLSIEDIKFSPEIAKCLEDLFEKLDTQITHLKVQFCCLQNVGETQFADVVRACSPSELSVAFLRNIRTEVFIECLQHSISKCTFVDLSNLCFSRFLCKQALQRTKASFLCLEFDNDLTAADVLQAIEKQHARLENWRIMLAESRNELATLCEAIRSIDRSLSASVVRDNCVEVERL